MDWKKKLQRFVLLGIALAFLTACAQTTPAAVSFTATREPAATFTPSPLPPTATLAPSSTPEPVATATSIPNYPPEGYGPGGFPADVNPLTGLRVADPNLLNRRPIVIKVENLPREHRPQYGLSLADLVFEYYTEQGTTRFAAVFYGQDADKVGPIRSGRFFDVHVVQMYRAVFIFGSAYSAFFNRFANSDFASRMVLENPQSCPALCRFEPQGRNFLMANTRELGAYLKSRNVDNSRQPLDGMYFNLQAPAGGEVGEQVYVRYSGAIYNRWDYDPATGRYLRFVDAKDDINRNDPQYVQLTDALTNQPVAADTVVTLCVPHEYFFKSAEIEVLDMKMDASAGSYRGCDGQIYSGGTGAAYVARDGKIYKAQWSRPKQDAPLTLLDEQGNPFPFKPGQSWFEVIGASSKVEKSDNGYRFTFAIAP